MSVGIRFHCLAWEKILSVIQGSIEVCTNITFQNSTHPMPGHVQTPNLDIAARTVLVACTESLKFTAGEKGKGQGTSLCILLSNNYSM